MGKVCSKKENGFTIVELLVVIVVIGVLAAISIVSYTGISQRAILASLQSDLSNSADQLKIASVYNGTYPSTIDCGQADSTTNKCLQASSGNSYTYFISDDTTFTLVSSNGDNTCIVTETTAPTCSPVRMALSVNTASDGMFQCSIISDGKSYCWGSNVFGQYGNNTNIQSLTPVPFTTTGALSGKTVKYVSSGYGHTCAIASDNLVYCWGLNSSGQLGNNSTSISYVPVAVNTSGVLNGKTIKSITAGDNYTCAIASDNLAYCWGGAGYGQLGNNSTTNSLIPVAVNTSGVLNGKTIKSIKANYYHTCAIASDNLAYCWGENNVGQLGNNTTGNSLIPVAVSTSGVLSGKTMKAIGTGSQHSCALASDNLAYCWGLSSSGQLGNNSTSTSLVPVTVSTVGVLSGKTVTSLAVGGFHNCVIASDNLAYCWGLNSSGQLGNNSTTTSLVPVAVNTSGVLSGKTIRSIGAGSEHVCATASDNLAYCWGRGDYGQLGNNSTSGSLVPVAVVQP